MVVASESTPGSGPAPQQQTVPAIAQLYASGPIQAAAGVGFSYA